MSARRPMVAGNWKMHGETAANATLIDALRHRLSGSPVEVVVCPSFVHLSEVGARLLGSGIALGAQDLCEHTGTGAYTGEVSGVMLRQTGCSQVIVGHSERRSLYGETDFQVAQKVLAAQSAGLIPILCVGERLEERDAGQTRAVIDRQLDAVIDGCGLAAFGQLVIAYEPVWAIGTGRTATPEQAEEIHAHIRGRIRARDATIAGSVRILYGGSVKAGNARELFAMPNVDGGLIGGASLKAEEFVAIVAAAAS